MEFIALIGSIALIYMIYRYNNPREDKQHYDYYDNQTMQSHYSEPHTINHVVTHVAPRDKKGHKGKRSLVCPTCHSVDVDMMDDNRKGFSLKKAVVGTIIFLPAGGFAGFAGGKRNKKIFRCRNCGQLFKFKVK